MGTDEDAAIDIASRIQGWMKEMELRWLYRTARTLKTGNVWVEIGSWKGRSMAAVVLGMPSGTRFASVDNFTGDIGSKIQGEIEWPGGWVSGHRGLAGRMLHARRPDVMIELFSEGSLTDIDRFDDRSVAVVFIDGEHVEESVTADVLAWTQKVMPGGLICGHDSCAPGVNECLKKHVRGWEPGPGSIWTKRL